MKIIGTGHYLPSKIINNHYFEQTLDTSDEWIVTRTGIKERRFATDETTTTLGYNASLQAINNANINKEDIGVIVVATMTPDYLTPSCACMIASKLGLNNSNVMALDINAACSGFVYGMSVANSLLTTNSKKYALLIGTEKLSSILDFEDRTTCVLFGDGAGAVIIQNDDKKLCSYQNCIGNDEALYALSNERKLRMNGKDVFKFAVKAIPEAINSVLEKSNLTLDDIDYVVCHQANLRIITHVYKKLKCPSNKFYVNLDKLGNTSGASIPLALSMMNEEKLLKDGMKIICVGFGGGLTYGATLFEW
ncbi:MAG: ketoacyl-ACP synthase III [Thomasclavelia sp.]|jgi:3-oxoacyl-[acyl-carrier-protein] synthase-3|nr:ketoacyl-ACP synthase III [Thomasclavelia sp.]